MLAFGLVPLAVCVVAFVGTGSASAAKNGPPLVNVSGTLLSPTLELAIH